MYEQIEDLGSNKDDFLSWYSLTPTLFEDIDTGRVNELITQYYDGNEEALIFNKTTGSVVSGEDMDSAPTTSSDYGFIQAVEGSETIEKIDQQTLAQRNINANNTLYEPTLLTASLISLFGENFSLKKQLDIQENTSFIDPMETGIYSTDIPVCEASLTSRDDGRSLQYCIDVHNTSDDVTAMHVNTMKTIQEVYPTPSPSSISTYSGYGTDLSPFSITDPNMKRKRKQKEYRENQKIKKQKLFDEEIFQKNLKQDLNKTINVMSSEIKTICLTKPEVLQARFMEMLHDEYSKKIEAKQIYELYRNLMTLLQEENPDAAFTIRKNVLQFNKHLENT